MPLIINPPSGNGKEYKLVPAGTWQAICNMIVDLGWQEVTYKGKTDIKPQIFVRWELPTERTDEINGVTQPLSIGRRYTNTFHEKGKLRQHLEAWRGRAFTPTELNNFDIFNLLGKCCQISVKHVTGENGRTYANVEEVVAWPKGLKRPATTEIGPLRYSPSEPQQLPDLPQWLRDKIASQKQRPALPEAPAADTDLDDDIPF